MDTLLQDIRYGVRMVAKSPGFAAIAILTLALGIGANTALFSVVNGVLLNPLPYRQPDRLVAIYAKNKEFSQGYSISYPNFLDWVRSQRSFSSMAAFREDDYNLTGMGEAERVKAEMISADFFPVLGVNPVVGRLLRAEEDQVGAQPVALISGGFWKRKFGSSPDALGKTLRLNGVGYTVVGVIPADFHYRSGNFHDSDVYVPLGQWNDPTFRDRHTSMGMDAVGRLKPGVTLEQARADMDSVAQGLAETYPEADKGLGIALLPLKQDVVGEIRPFLLVLLAAVGFVLLIACVNVANLLLARSTGRTREFAIRVALGAGQGRLIRQLLTESLVLSCAGGGLGLLLASWGTQAGIRLMPEALPRAESVFVDSRVLLFTLAASVLSGIFFGLAPALRSSRVDLHATLKEGGRGSSGARHRLQGVLVVVEMAMALVLLVGAGLMIRSLGKLWSVDPGFDPRHVVTFAVSYPTTPDATPDAIRASMRQLQDTVAAGPGVQAASLNAGALPMQGDSEVPFWIAGQPKPATTSDMKTSLFYIVEPDYLKAMGISLERGRFLTHADNEHAIAVAPSDPNIVYVGTGRGIYAASIPMASACTSRSTPGKTWTHIGLSTAMCHIGKMAVDPTDPNLVYVAALGDIYNANGGIAELYRSIDGGATWARNSEPPTTRTSRAQLMAIRQHPRNNLCIAVGYAPSAMVDVCAVQYAGGGSLNPPMEATHGSNHRGPADQINLSARSASRSSVSNPHRL